VTDAPPGAPSITIRRVRFQYPQGIDPIIVPGQPEQSYLNVALSLLLPYLEPYLIRSMRQARPLVRDPRLLAELDLFNGQEAQHYKQHIVFNEAVHIPGGERVKALEEELDADYRRFTKERSLRWNLAYAEGFEAFTLAMTRFSFEVGLFRRIEPRVRDLFTWHLMEEMEHRTVAFDVYAHVCGGYFYRLFVGLYAQWHLNRFLNRAADAMARADVAAHRARFGGLWKTSRRVAPLLVEAVTYLLPKVLATYLPWYSPRRISMPPEALALADHYAQLAKGHGPQASSEALQPLG
jgi:predicted metal-dependent hydrolase